ncbi:hypothetical protein [Microbacterium stercoris]|uniref:Uncharacterized protein n=1 Tax=Microbacterium stercoris TaxID=2820289 RepID=A0A939QRZ9_9MICO|nr:hypothetical protein [Microbacterium stercoris]MBO3663551.1 hypothetical protein [Microbacterium stercoris]
MTDHLAESSMRPARVVSREDARVGAAAIPAPRVRRPSRGRTATFALMFAFLSLSLSWFGSFALPFAVLANLLAAGTLIFRRAQRELAWWALGLSLTAAACSAYWIWQAALKAAEAAGS